MNFTNVNFEITVTNKELALLRSVARDVLPIIHVAGDMCKRGLSDIERVELEELIDDINSDLNHDGAIDVLRSLRDLE